MTFATAGGPAGAIPPSKPVCFGVSGAKGDAAIVNLTPVLANGAGNGQLVALGLAKKPPKAANVNFDLNTVDPNVAFSQVGTRGSVCFINSKQASVELIADHLGTVRGKYYKFAQKNGAPKRVLNTRDGKMIKPSKTSCFAVAGKPGDVAVVNLTPVGATAAGNGQLVSSDVAKKPPKAANVNFARGTVDPNVALARIGKDNKVCFVNSKHASVHVIADHLGTIKGSAYISSQKNGAPKRVLDTKKAGKIIKPGGSGCFKVAGSPGDAAVVNLTPINATGGGNGQLVSSNVKKKPPKAANVNFDRGTVDPNVAIARIGDDGKVCFINSKQASVHVIADHLGTIKGDAYTPARKNGAPLRALDTRDQAEITPVSTKGPRPVRPSEVSLACAYDAGFVNYSSRRVTFDGLDGTRNDFTITFYNDPLPNKGKDRVYNDSVTGASGVSYVYTLYSTGEIPNKINWNGRVGIETYKNQPELTSMAIFEVSDLCDQNTRLEPEGDGAAAAATTDGVVTKVVTEEYPG